MGGRPREEERSARDSTVAAENKRVVRGYFNAVWNERDLSVIDTDLVSDDYVLHAQSNDDDSLAQLRTAWADWYGDYPPLERHRGRASRADRVVIRYRFSGTHEGKVMDIPATGKAAETAGIMVFRLRDGQIVKAWAMDDVLELGQQLDVRAYPRDPIESQ